MAQNKISIIIPMYNASNSIENCLSNISKQTMGDFEVLLVDDCSTDDTVRKAGKYPFKIIKLEKRLSPAKVRNYGVKYASGNILIFIDADVALKPDSIEAIMGLISRPDTDAVFGAYAEDTPQTGFFSQFQNLFIIYRCKKIPISTDITCSFFCAIKKSAFDAVGGYNEEMSYYEDVEIGKRLTIKGYHCKFEPDLKVTHLKYYNHSRLIMDYFRKAAAVGLYIKREGFGNKIKNNTWPLSIKTAVISGLCLLFSMALIKITLIPFFLFFGIYNISVSPLLSYLVKTRNLAFGVKSYLMLFEIYLAFFTGLSCGILRRDRHD